MIFECRLCRRVKKFGEWIDAPFEFRELARRLEVEIAYVLCPDCRKRVLVLLRFSGQVHYQ
jgi:NMD protein affecting ribosome stability and mRNA decay